jgi:hypothetical protein
MEGEAGGEASEEICLILRLSQSVTLLNTKRSVGIWITNDMVPFALPLCTHEIDPSMIPTPEVAMRNSLELF